MVLLFGKALSGGCHGPKGRWAAFLRRNVPRHHTQRSSLLPELKVGWRDLGGLAQTLALEKASICT